MPTSPVIPPARIGVIGGGQLAKMMTQKAKKLGYEVVVLDPAPDSPAGQMADEEITGGFHDPAKLREIVEKCDLTTYDLEHIGVETLIELEDEGRLIRPSARLLAVVQDKLEQRRRFAAAGLPQPEFDACDEPSPAAFQAFGYPLVQKARRGGYDGRGVALVRAANDLDRMLRTPSLLERLVPIEKELAVLVARSPSGDTRVYPLVEMVVDPEANLLDLLLAPARVSPQVDRRACEIALGAVEALGGVGIFGLELFLTESGELLVNEIAPRPHNSGHFTFEACATSQFEQHLRAVAGLPLGAVEQYRPAAMVNLLGEPGGAGPPVLEGFCEALATPGAHVHIYGKAESRPNRKMGHVTVLDTDLEAAREKAVRIRETLKIRGGRQG